LPQLLAAPLATTIYLVEGEKDADALSSLSFVATTASEGANAKWAPEVTAYFKNRRVVVPTE
jgi:DNA primase